MSIIYENLLEFTWQQGVMILIGALLIFLAIKKEMEPTLLLPLGFGTILVNIPNADAALETVIGVFVCRHRAVNPIFPPLSRHGAQVRLA